MSVVGSITSYRACARDFRSPPTCRHLLGFSYARFRRVNAKSHSLCARWYVSERPPHSHDDEENRTAYMKFFKLIHAHRCGPNADAVKWTHMATDEDPIGWAETSQRQGSGNGADPTASAGVLISSSNPAAAMPAIPLQPARSTPAVRPATTAAAPVRLSAPLRSMTAQYRHCERREQWSCRQCRGTRRGGQRHR
jgi:hypothetical protein